MKNFSKRILQKITKKLQMILKNELEKVLEIFTKIRPQYIVYKNKIGKNFRGFQIKEEGHHYMLWCP